MPGQANYPLVMRIGQYVFRARLVPTLVTLILLPILIRLGFWQLERAQLKQDIQTLYEQRMSQAHQPLKGLVKEAGSMRYRRVVVRGEYDETQQILLDNQVHNTVAGYHVLTPLRIAQTDVRVFIDRGWVPLGNSRAVLPKIDTPKGVVEVHGLVYVPSENVFKLGSKDTNMAITNNAGWPVVVQWLDMMGFAKKMGVALQPFIIWQDPKDPHGFVREWRVISASPEKSTSYAVQWFVLAAALLIIYLVVNLRKAEPQ